MHITSFFNAYMYNAERQIICLELTESQLVNYVCKTDWLSKFYNDKMEKSKQYKLLTSITLKQHVNTKICLK